MPELLSWCLHANGGDVAACNDDVAGAGVRCHGYAQMAVSSLLATTALPLPASLTQWLLLSGGAVNWLQL